MSGGFELVLIWMLLALFWAVLIGVIVVLVVRLSRTSGDARMSGGAGSCGPVAGGAGSVGPGEQPEAILDRMFALGEIDEATYRARRTALAEMRTMP